MRKTFTQCCLAMLIVPVLTFMLIGTIALAASGGGGGSLTLNENAKTLEKDEMVTLTATAAGAADGANITWSTDNGDAVKLSGTTGATVTVTAKEVSAESRARVTATCKYTYKNDTSTSQTVTLEETCTIIVKAPSTSTTPTLNRIEVTLADISLEVGQNETHLPTVTAVMSDGSNSVLSSGYKIDGFNIDSTIATYTAAGALRGVKAGETQLRVTVSYNGKTETASCKVAVTEEKVNSIEITQPKPDVTGGAVSMSAGETRTCTVAVNPAGTRVTWSSSDSRVAVVENGSVRALAPGEATLTARAGDKEATLDILVSGFLLKKNSFEVEENGAIPLDGTDNPDGVFERYGSASLGDLTFWSSDPNVAEVVNGQVRGKSPGTVTINVSSKTSFRTQFTVTVKADRNSTIPQSGTISLKRDSTLPFSTLYSDFRAQAGGSLHHIMGLSVDTAKGTLYYRYESEAQNGLGVGDSTYYLNPSYGQRAISDITFVPKPSFIGGDVTINYTAVTDSNQNYTCRILLTVDPGEGTAAGVSLTTKYNTPLRFNANEFDRVCKERTGSRLSYVTFSLPNERQGTLYTNYVSKGNYGSLVQLRTQYSLRQLDDVWFVPAPGFEGTATVYYTARSVGTPGVSYSGQVNITVSPENGVGIGGVSYEIVKGGAARFDDVDFNDYCRENLDSGQTLSFIRFDSLPGESDGVLYYDYRSSTNTGSRASAGTTYYYGTRSPRIDRLTFVPNPDFVGTIRLPFTGQTVDGTRFSGNVEINVQGGTGSGDIYYTCAPGRSVSFDDSHFNRLCRDITGSTLNCIEFQSLPSSASGTLYISGSAARVNTRYRNGSSSPRIDNLSFRAASSFSGTVDIPFKGTATNGATFDGVVTVGTTSAGSSSGNIRYTTDSKSAAVFDRDDFDDLSRWETDRDISSVRFEVPSSSEGSLYRNYRSSSSQGTRITSTSSVTASELDRVAFIPASGYTGTVYINFRGTAASSGGSFDGQVEIEVGRAPADVTASYSTRTEPVQLNSGDLSRRGYTLSSVRFTSLPPASAGYLYYQYVSPTRYGSQASTGTSYQVSGGRQISDLYFVPRAGYSGTVSIPYTGTNSNGSTFEGEVLVTVSPGYRSNYFNDMSGYSPAQQSAVDFLYDHNITRGLTAGQYGPESHIRRGDFARMVYQAFELSPSTTTNAFYDVPSSAYYAEAVNALYARGVVSGTGGGYFSPNSALTRQDAICMVQRAMRTVGWSASDGYPGGLSGYSDGSSVSGYAQGAMSFALQRGYLPITDGRLSPTQPLTRVDMAEIIHRVLTY